MKGATQELSVETSRAILVAAATMVARGEAEPGDALTAVTVHFIEVSLFSGSGGRTRVGVSVGAYTSTICFMDASHLKRLDAAVAAARARIAPIK